MRITLKQLKKIIKEEISNMNHQTQLVSLSEDELSALKGAMTQGVDIESNPDWRKAYDSVFTILNDAATQYPVQIELPVGDAWNDEITQAIESEVMSSDDQDEDDSNDGDGDDFDDDYDSPTGNDYGVDRDELIFKVTGGQPT